MSSSAVTSSTAATTSTPASSASTSASRTSNSYDPYGAFPTAVSNPSGTPTSTSTSDGGSLGLVNYYYVFFAVILAIGAVAGFFFWRRRRMLTGRSPQPRPDQSWGQQQGWHGNYGSRQQWTGRWTPGEDTRIEGLNEEGEAPPPYIPKSDEARSRQPGQSAVHAQTEVARDSSAIPMRDLPARSAQTDQGAATNVRTTDQRPPEYDQSATNGQQRGHELTPAATARAPS